MLAQFLSSFLKPRKQKISNRIDVIARKKHLFISLRNAEKFEDLLILMEDCMNDLNALAEEAKNYPETLKKHEYLLSRLQFRKKEVLQILHMRSRKLEELGTDTPSRNDSATNGSSGHTDQMM